MNTKLAFSIVLLTGMLGCGDEVNQPAGTNLSAVDMAVQNMVDVVAAAADAYYTQNGTWADHPCDALVSFLPGGARLVNPVTEDATEPVSCDPTGAGSVGYRVFCTQEPNGTRVNIGYYIIGRGDSRDFVRTNVADVSEHLAREAQTFANGRTLRNAALAYAADNSGVYASDGATVNAEGKTLIDYLPDGHLMVNPYTGEESEPSIWANSSAEPLTFLGQIRYLAIDGNGDGTYSEGVLLEGTSSHPPQVSYVYANYEDEFEAATSEIGDNWPCVWP